MSTNAANKPETPKDVCVAKLGEPYKMYECGSPCEYLSAGQYGPTCSGWYHLDRELTIDHHAVPSRMIR